MSEYDSKLCQAAELIRTADGLIIAAGAGLGVDSGLPDYRTSKGLYTTACEAQTTVGEFAQMGSALYLEMIQRVSGSFSGGCTSSFLIRNHMRVTGIYSEWPLAAGTDMSSTPVTLISILYEQGLQQIAFLNATVV